MAENKSDTKKPTTQQKFRPKLQQIIPHLDFSFMGLRTIEGMLCFMKNIRLLHNCYDFQSGLFLFSSISIESLEYDARPNGALQVKVHGYLVKGSENIDKMPMPEDGSRPKSWSHSFKLCQNGLKTISGIRPIMEQLFFEPQNITWIDLSFNLIETVEDVSILLSYS